MSMLSVNKLSCQRGYNLLFENLSFELNSGEVLRISGQNGSGKTSLLKIIAGLNTPELGSIEFDQNQSNSETYQIETLYLGHYAALSSELSCIENLEYLTKLNTEILSPNFHDALKEIGLENYEHEPAGNLSAGQKRRIALSLLFISQSKLWLLDEPFTALDSDGIKIIENQIEKHCANGGLCILTTHQDCNIKSLKEISL
ncbi:MAG: cytochrome c biogenesis heme-transporting ATPase CcmA [Candidatus Thioglobus sp.]|jgi:heme exporter protein A|nr:cytochrome c biogenesis heme-transporting ATPase CcmA [Candidatus Pseudothioglobus aerophilus]MBT4245446.1 cytochrome c biogenesis heme-transporting ATPase CcmA [Gammaproteobacteria bacterium]